MAAYILTKKLWVFLRTYWSYIALVVAMVSTYLLLRRQTVDFGRQIQDIQDRHQKELEEIKQAHDEEARRLAENERKLTVRLEQIQKQFDAAQHQLDAEKKSQVAELVREYGDQPSVLAQKLSDVTGFTIVLPEES